MLSLDGTLVVQLVNFIVFLAILNVIFFKPVGAAIARRRAFIDGLRHDIEQYHVEAKSLRGQAEARRAAAAREAGEGCARARTSRASWIRSRTRSSAARSEGSHESRALGDVVPDRRRGGLFGRRGA